MFTRTPDIFSYNYGIFDYDKYIEIENKKTNAKKKIENLKKEIKKYKNNSETRKANYINKFGSFVGQSMFLWNETDFYHDKNLQIQEEEKKLVELKNNNEYKILDFDIYKIADSDKKANTTSYSVEILDKQTGYARKTYIYDYKYAEKGKIKVIASKELNSFTDNINNIIDMKGKSLSEIKKENLSVRKYVNLIKQQLLKYLYEKHRLSINTETNIYKYYDLIGFRIVNNPETQGTLQVEMDFIQNISIGDNQIDTVELGNKD